ncbi:DNA helicase UvrD [Achromobacter insolitus]|uniref:DNA helicase UvrD n=1 Tax=Achromobacter insolitus TaxID=217204 RepID=UPI0028A84301|nr:DNA helicase UvrD [Achromobacter insolitus]
MAAHVMFAVAGSGKTTTLIERLNLEQRALIVTYTENNYAHLLRSVIRKFGYVPPNITLMTYFGFLNGFCYRPQLELRLGTRGLSFRAPPDYTRNIARSRIAYYKDDKGYLFYNRLAKLLQATDKIPRIIARIERFYDQFFIDEVQDFAGHDFDLLIGLMPARVDILLVGDFYQHTFDTSRDGPTNRTLHHDINRYERRFSDARVHVDKETLSNSWRCGPTICGFISSYLQININSHRQDETSIIPVTTQEHANAIHSDSEIIKLFYQESYKYQCEALNWGASKGMDHFQDVCVVLSEQNWRLYLGGNFAAMSASTRNKLYVACSRARGNLYLAREQHFRCFKA